MNVTEGYPELLEVWLYSLGDILFHFKFLKQFCLADLKV